MIKRKILSVLLVATILLGITACGNKSTTPTPTPSESTSTGTPSETTPDTDKEPGDIYSWVFEEDRNISGTVRFWIPFKGEQGMNDMIADFNKEYPNIKVELTTYNNNSDGNLSVNTAIMAGEVDVLASFGLNNTYRRWENGLFLDLTDKVAQEGIDLVANWGTDVYKFEDRIYSFPCGGMSYYISINKNAWDEAGLGDIPTEWTWDEYLEACRKMTKKDSTGKTLVYGGSDYHSINYFTYAKYQVTGKNAAYNDETGLSSLDSELIINSLERELKAENEEGIWFPLKTYRADNIQTQMVYTDGTVASAIGPNMIRFIRDTENYPMDWVTYFAPYPTEEKGQTNYMSGVSVFSHAGITLGCQDEAAAWAFLKYYSTYGSRYLIIAGHQSTWKGTDVNGLVELVFGSEEEAAKLIDVESFKRCVVNYDNPAFVDTIVTAISEVTDIINEYGLYAANGQMSARDAMIEAAELANDAIKKAQ
ncbi:MAG: carbohydrate ABC transporter substrate-binding protein [Clostridiaceae bacterium]|nr:carbohydrate ABC transporter substrate-binding protein [Clostridiaceae bacterium]